MKGKFIVAYGMNNLGKTTASKALADFLLARGIPASYLKYAIYDLEPTGPKINAYLRKGNPEGLTPLQFQQLQVQNRRDYEPELKRRLKEGEWIIAEDYVGTGIAWGMIAGVPLETLEKMNTGLLKPNLEFLMDGERFSTGIETNHKHEEATELWPRGRTIHLELASRYGWPIVSANQTREQVLESIVSLARERFSLTVEGNCRTKENK